MAVTLQEKQIDQTAQLLKILAHPTRLQILYTLGSHAWLDIASLEEHLPFDQTTIGYHLMKMTDNKLVARKRKGRKSYYRLNEPLLAYILNTLI